MLRNQLKIAFRNLWRHKGYAFINIMGLAIGLTCFSFIFLFIQDELSYEKPHSKAERTYRIVEIIDSEGVGEESASAPFPVGPTLFQDHADLIQSYVRFFDFQTPAHTFKYEDKRFNEKGLYFVDSTLFDIFDFKLLKGDAATALAQPNSIIITQEIAHKYFGDEDPMGKVLELETFFKMQVTGVLEAPPTNSHLSFDLLGSFSTLKQAFGGNYPPNWVWNPCWTYFLMKPDATPQALEARFPDFVEKYFPALIKKDVSLYLQPIADIHLHSKLDFEMGPNSNIAYTYIFTAIAFFILLIACINFMNLATARSAGRAKEVGIRKTLGAHRMSLVRQFLGESMLMTFISILVSLIFIELLLPFFNQLAGKSVSLSFIQSPEMVLFFIGLGIVVGLLSGTYPAFFLSSFLPVKVLKGVFKAEARHGLFFRKALVIIQFTVSIVLIIGTVIAFRQLHHMKDAELGFSKESVMVLPIARTTLVPKYEEAKTQLLQHPDIASVSTMDMIIGTANQTREYRPEGTPQDKWTYLPCISIREDFVETMGIQVIAGRDFSKDFPRDDSTGMLINEAMVRHLGWGSPQEALGKKFGSLTGNEKIVGVVANFHYNSLHDPVGPLVLDLPSKVTGERNFFTKYMVLRTQAHSTEVIPFIKGIWEQFDQNHPFEYFFLEDELAKLYRDEDKLSRIALYFSLLAIAIACLGLFGLVAFKAGQRTKEIGVRKVLGASTPTIVSLLSKEFLGLVFLSNLLAWPLAWYMMNQWLQNFAYRTDIPFWVFILAAFLALVIALLTVSFQAIKAALTNPVQSLRYE